MIFTKDEEKRVIDAIRQAEEKTSGEIRLFVEDVCEHEHPVERAAELFHLLEMHKTRLRNGALVYIAEKSHHFAIWGDTGIHDRVGFMFWDSERQLLLHHLKAGTAAEGVCLVIEQIGEQLAKFFPPETGNNNNELPDDIVYG